MKIILSIHLSVILLLIPWLHIFPQSSDTEKADSLFNVGKLMNSCEESIEYYLEAITYNPNISNYYYELAKCYYEKGEDDEALKNFDHSIRIKEGPNNLYNRATVYFQMYDENNGNILFARNALNDFLKIKENYPNFEKENVDKQINDLESILTSSKSVDKVSYDSLGNRLYRFHLENSHVFYLRLPELLTTSTFNIIKQDPYNTGPSSTKFLLERGKKNRFLSAFASFLNEIRKEGKLLIITIDDHEKVGVQHGLEYGVDTNSMNHPSPYTTWINNNEIEITGWLKFDEGELDLIQHNGKLIIRVLNNSRPVKLIGCSIGCSKGPIPEYFDNAIYEKIIEVYDCEMTTINVKITLPDETRWLLDRYSENPILMEDYSLEINGKLFPNDMKYVVLKENEKKEKSADFKVRLKKIP